LNKQSFLSKVRKFAAGIGLTEAEVGRALVNAIVETAFFDVAKNLEFASYLKGGSAQVWRSGLVDSRFTRDVDLVTSAEREQLLELLRALAGFKIGFFTIGATAIQPNRTNSKVPDDYRLLVAKISVLVSGSAWLTCELEILPLEHDFNSPKLAVAHETLAALFQTFDLPVSQEIPLISLELQVAEKLHALTEPGSQRATDLHDIAQILQRFPIASERLSGEVGRVFARRASHELDPLWLPSKELQAQFLLFGTADQLAMSTERVSGLLRNLGAR
jgi:hypothetical protein